MGKLRKKLSSIRVKLFLSLCVVVIIIITFLIIVNNFILETFYLYSKKNTLKTVYDKYRIYTPDILNSLSHFEQECLNFQNDFNIKILDDKLFIDRFGFILLANNQDLINKNVFELDLKPLKEVKTAILYNILISMIYRAIFLKLKEESIEYSQMFKIVHERIFY